MLGKLPTSFCSCSRTWPAAKPTWPALRPAWLSWSRLPQRRRQQQGAHWRQQDSRARACVRCQPCLCRPSPKLLLLQGQPPQGMWLGASLGSTWLAVVTRQTAATARQQAGAAQRLQ